MKFSLSQKVRVKRCNKYYGSPAGKGMVTGMYLENFQDGAVFYQIQLENGQVCNYAEDSIRELKTQTLYAYKDSTDEVHWSTRKYDGKERSNFGFVEAFDFNKTIDLE